MKDKQQERKRHRPEDCPMRGVYPEGHITYSDQCDDCICPDESHAKGAG